jgi:hypothetical protein
MDRGQNIHCAGLIGCKIHKHIHMKRVNNSATWIWDRATTNTRIFKKYGTE